MDVGILLFVSVGRDRFLFRGSSLVIVVVFTLEFLREVEEREDLTEEEEDDDEDDRLGFDCGGYFAVEFTDLPTADDEEDDLVTVFDDTGNRAVAAASNEGIIGRWSINLEKK